MPVEYMAGQERSAKPWYFEPLVGWMYEVGRAGSALIEDEEQWKEMMHSGYVVEAQPVVTLELANILNSKRAAHESQVPTEKR